MSGATADVAIVLPPRESFSAAGAGAVALLVHEATLAPSRYRRLVVGTPCTAPFADVAYAPVRKRFGLGSAAHRYAAAVVRSIGAAKLVEVHNRPAVALRIARLRPGLGVSLFLHNDPQAMRGLRTPRERQAACRALAGVVAVSAFVGERLIDGTTLVPVVLTNGIDLARVPAAAAGRERLILYVGRLVADKGADAFVAGCALALPLLPGWRAEAIGADRFAADSPVTPFIVALARAADAAGVTLAGYQPHAQVLAAMTRAAIVVVPSRWAEPFGMAALEAMACGAALICSGRGGLAELVGEVAVPCDPDAPETIASAVRQLARDPRARAARAAAGIKRAAQFDVRVAARRLDAYRDGLLAAAAVLI